jgi:ABC-type glutathione transport system ATPase component
MNSQPLGNPPLLMVRNLSHAYQTSHLFGSSAAPVQAFTDIHLVVHRGTTVALVGESGTGKSSLARCLALLERPASGEILFEGQNVLRANRTELLFFRRAVQLVFQDPTSSLNPRLTAAELIAEPLVVQQQDSPEQRRKRALELMDVVGLPSKSSLKRPLEFSGGQRQRLAIARALALSPRLLILDEALSSLDVENQDLILGLLVRLQAELSLTYIHVSHDLRLVSTVADEIAVMHGGRIVEHKPASALLAHQEDPYARALFARRSSVRAILAERFAESHP